MFVNGDVQVHGAFGQLKSEQNRLAVQRSPRSYIDQENFWWMDFKFEPAVIQLRHGVANHHVGEFTDDLARGFLGGGAYDLGKIGSRLTGGGCVHVENDASLNV